MSKVFKIYKTRDDVIIGPRSSIGFKTTRPALTEFSKMKQTSNTKKSLGRVWFRYSQLYGMTSKLTAACVNIGWTRVNMDTYAEEHYHLVNQFTANMVRNNEPNVPQPGDLDWLTKSPCSGRNWKGTTNTSARGPKEEKTPKIQTRNHSAERNKKVPKVFRTAHMTNAISKTGKGDSSGPQSIRAFPKRCDIGFAGVRRGLFSGIVGRF